MDIKPIKNKRDYEQALGRVESLWKSPEGSAESDELDVLATLIDSQIRSSSPSSCSRPTIGASERARSSAGRGVVATRSPSDATWPPWS